MSYIRPDLNRLKPTDFYREYDADFGSLEPNALNLRSYPR
jgi:hypothetical protein